MTSERIIEQPNLFEQHNESAEIEKILLFALGEFQSRGKVLANRELPLDRLRGAFKRASEKFGAEEFPDEIIAKGIRKTRRENRQSPEFRRQTSVSRNRFKCNCRTFASSFITKGKTILRGRKTMKVTKTFVSLFLINFSNWLCFGFHRFKKRY